MSLNIPPNIEAIAKEKAALAGLSDVEIFVHRIIENASPEQALLPLPTDPHIIAAINEGVAGGVEGEIDQAFWDERSKTLESYIADRQNPNR